MPTFFFPPGSGGGGAGSTSAPWKNYIISGNNNAENNNTTGWTIQNVGVTSTFYPRFTGASWAAANAGLSLGVLTGTSALAGAYSYYLYSNAISTLGDALMTAPITIDPADRTQPLAFKFYYSPMLGGASLAFYGTSGNSWAIWIYDTANTAWIQPAGTFNMVQSSGVGIATGTFQAPSNMSTFQLAMINITASGGSYLVGFDDFFVGPQTQPTGPAMTDPVTFTPTGAWSTNTTYTGSWRRVGDSMEIQYYLALTGAPTSATLSLNMPAGYTIDSTKILNTTAGNVVFDSQVRFLGAGANVYGGHATYNTTSIINLRYYNTISGSNPQPVDLLPITQAAPVTFANGDWVSVRVRVPILGWSSNTAMSSDTDTRVIASAMTGATATVTGSYSDVTWTTIVNDTHGAMGAILYTVPVSGYYDIAGAISVGATSLSAAGGFFVSLFNNTTSTTMRENQFLFDLNVPENESLDFNYQSIYLNSGTTIKIQIKTTGTVGTPVINNSATLNYLSVSRKSGPAIVSATDAIAMRYTTTTGTTITSSPAVIPFGTKSYDSHGAYATGTGLYTVPVSGKYRIYGRFWTASVNLSTSQVLQAFVYQNGAQVDEAVCAVGNGVANAHTAQITSELNCNAGDTLAIYAASSVSTTVNTGANLNAITINRIGN